MTDLLGPVKDGHVKNAWQYLGCYIVTLRDVPSIQKSKMS